MSFFSKIVENKGVALAVVGGALAVLFAANLYKGYRDQDKQESQGENDKYDQQKEIQALKSQINASNPSLEDVKQVLSFSMNVAKRRIVNYSKQFKRKRQQFDSSDRKNKTTDYMNVIVNGMDEVRNLAVITQSQIMKELGLSEAVFMKYQNQLGLFMQELMMSQGRSLNSEKKITLQEVKYAIRLQIQYLKNQGQEMIDRVLQATKNWPPAKKRELPLLFSVVIADGAFQDHPEIDEEAIQAAEVQMQNYLMSEMNELHQVMAPLLTKMTKQVGGGGMGMGMGMGMGGMEEDMFAGGFSEQQMQQMQQLQQLRMSDPAAFEQLMRNFHG